MHIYHITRRTDWNQAQESGSYQSDSLASQGFIHCSTAEQVQGVLERFYAGQTGLLVLEIDSKKLSNPLKWEPGMDKAEELFPHLYGVLNLEAVCGVREVS